MLGWIPPRLRPLLGASLEAVTEQHLQSLIGLPEDYDLDYKRQRYRTGGKGPIDAAADIAAFANASGGLLIVGIEEDGTGVASKLYPDTSQDDLGVWLDQVAAARVSPTPPIRHRTIPIAGGSAHIVSVAPSTKKPHAVTTGDNTLKYPVRSGTMTRYMSEPEIADQYYRRIQSTIDLQSSIEALNREATSILQTADMLDNRSWLILSSVPSAPGNLELESGIAEQWVDWIEPALRDFPTQPGMDWLFTSRYLNHASVGFRSILLTDRDTGGLGFNHSFASLRLDGSGFIAFGHPGIRSIHNDASEMRDVYDEHVVVDVIHGLGVLSNHAIRTGATGDLSIGSQLCSDRPVALFQYRSHHYCGQLGNTRAVDRRTPLGMRSTPIEGPALPSPDLVALTRSVVTDLFSSFGLAQPIQITARNQLVLRGFYRDQSGPIDIHRNIEKWATSAGIESINSPT